MSGAPSGKLKERREGEGRGERGSEREKEVGGGGGGGRKRLSTHPPVLVENTGDPVRNSLPDGYSILPSVA